MSASQNLKVTWKNVPTRTITAGGVEFAYRELGTNNPGTPVVFLIHLAAVLDNWDPRVVDGFAAEHHVITFDNRSTGSRVFSISWSTLYSTTCRRIQRSAEALRVMAMISSCRDSPFLKWYTTTGMCVSPSRTSRCN